MGNKRILFVSPWFSTSGIGGVGSVIERLRKDLTEKGHKVDILCARATFGFNIGETKSIKKVSDEPPIYVLGFRSLEDPSRSFLNKMALRFILFPWFYLSLFFFLLKHRIQVIHIHFFYPFFRPLVTLKRLLGIKLFINFYGSDANIEPRKYPNYVVDTQKELDRADRVIVISEMMKKTIMETYRIEESKVHVIYNGIRIEEIIGNVRPVEYRYILLVASAMLKIKGLDVAIRAIREAKNSIPDIKLLIVSDGPERELYEKMIADLGLSDNVLVIGLMGKSELNAYYEGCDFLIVPSRMEGLPLVILEAFLARKPVIAARVGGIPELVKEGYNGDLFSSEDHDELAEKIVRLCLDKEMMEIYGKNGYRIAQEFFSLERQIQNLLLVYEGREPIGYNIEKLIEKG